MGYLFSADGRIYHVLFNLHYRVGPGSRHGHPGAENDNAVA